MTGKDLATSPAQQQIRDPFDGGDQRLEGEMNPAERPRQQNAQSRWKYSEQHLGQQIEQDVKQENRDRINQYEPTQPPGQRVVQHHYQPAQDQGIGYSITDQ